jgi:hypothetical protein
MVGGLVVIPSGFYFGKSKPRPNLGKERSRGRAASCTSFSGAGFCFSSDLSEHGEPDRHKVRQHLLDMAIEWLGRAKAKEVKRPEPA